MPVSSAYLIQFDTIIYTSREKSSGRTAPREPQQGASTRTMVTRQPAPVLCALPGGRFLSRVNAFPDVPVTGRAGQLEIPPARAASAN